MEFLGRLDQQVKIRGYRIELAEIETALSQHPAVRETVVLAREDEPGNKRLIAYLVMAAGHDEPLTGDLQHYLHDRLPEYMIPAAFVCMESLPLTPNGKVDRQALPALAAARPTLGSVYEAPQTPVEEEVTQIWCDVLGLGRVGTADNFFELGGNSLQGTQVLSRLCAAFQVELSLRQLFEGPTVGKLAKLIEAQRSEASLGSSQAAFVPISRLSRANVVLAQQSTAETGGEA